MTLSDLLREPLISIGYWSGGYDEGGWPDVNDFVDEEWDEDDRLEVGVYLRNGLVARAWLGYSPCRICGDPRNGNLDLTDGIYIWPEGLTHYVLEHHVRLPPEFIDHVHARNELTDDVRVDETWWRTVTPPGPRAHPAP